MPPRGRFRHVRKNDHRRHQKPHHQHVRRNRRLGRRPVDAISISSQTEQSQTPKNPETIQAKAMPRSSSSSSALQQNPGKPLKGIKSFKRSRWIDGSWHKCDPTSWHPPLTLWTRPLIEAQIGQRPSQSITSTEESRRLFECPCTIPIIKCKTCRLNCCRNCSYRNWHQCWLCAFRRTHPRAHIHGVPTLDQFMWEDKRHWFMEAMNDHT
jgi:hypothetical protein